MRNILILGMMAMAAFMAGWFTIDRDGDSTSIEINRAEIREDARRYIEKGREYLDRRDQQFANDQNPSSQNMGNNGVATQPSFGTQQPFGPQQQFSPQQQFPAQQLPNNQAPFNPNSQFGTQPQFTGAPSTQGNFGPQPNFNQPNFQQSPFQQAQFQQAQFQQEPFQNQAAPFQQAPANNVQTGNAGFNQNFGNPADPRFAPRQNFDNRR